MNLSDLIINGNVAAVAQALHSKTNLNKQDEYGFTPLTQAAFCDEPEIIKILLKAKADVNSKDAYGNTALHWAISRGNYEIIEFLLKNKADPNCFDNQGQPVLVMPIVKNQRKIINLLLAYGAKTSFAQDYIRTKLIGHLFELEGKSYIMGPNDKYVPVSYEGLFLEFTIKIIKDSFTKYIASQQPKDLLSGKNRQNIIQALDNALFFIREEFTSNLNKSLDNISQIFHHKLLLIPVAYEGHAITLIKYNNYFVKCDRGVSKVLDTVIIYKISKPENFTRSLIYDLVYKDKTKTFINHEINDILKLEPVATIPAKYQLSGNCSWANVEISIPAMLFILKIQAKDDFKRTNKLKEQAMLLHKKWISWQKYISINNTIKQIKNSPYLRQISLAINLGAILYQRCNAANAQEIEIARKIINVLLKVEKLKFILISYIKTYCRPSTGQIGEKFSKLLVASGLDINTLSLKKANPELNLELSNSKEKIFIAVKSKDIKALQYLVNIGVDINSKDDKGNTPLMHACYKGDLEIIKLLCDKLGADFNIRNKKGHQAIHYAAYQGYNHIVSYLLDKNADWA